MPKLSKAEKERLKKEEAERKAQEEEEARQQQERDEAEQKEREKQEAEERRRLENEERKKRKGQLQELEALWESCRTKLLNEQVERRKNAKWERYMLCDGSPDPTIPGEINTFMNLWREDKNHISIETVLQDSKLPLRLIAELDFLLQDTPKEDITDAEIERYKDTITQLQGLLGVKLNIASHNLSLKASQLADSETMNLQQVCGNDTITLCLWGNLSKNPRIKSFDFEEQGFMFELPKLLTLSDIGVRLLITKFDHLSPHCRTFLPRVKKAEAEVVEAAEPEEPAADAAGEGGEGEDGAAKEGGGDGEPDVSREQTQMDDSSDEDDDDEDDDDDDGEDDDDDNKAETSSRKAGGKKEVGAARKARREADSRLSGEDADVEDEDDDDVDDDGQSSISDVMAALRGLEDEDEDEDKPKQEEEQPAEEEPLEEDYEIKTPEPLDLEDFDGDDDVIDLRAYHVVGGVYHFNLLHLPPQPKQVNDWIITQVQHPAELNMYDYVADVVAAPTPAPDKDDEKKSEGSAAPKREEKPPIGVTIRLPGDVYFCEEPQVARWDSTTNEWKVDGFSDHKFEEEARTLYFKTAFYGTLALVQDAHINMPFQSWELRPRGTNHALLTVIAAIVEVEIEIKDDKVSLVAPADKPELSHLINQWMPVQDFIQKMRTSGVNIFPAEDSFKYVSIQNKNSVTEERLYQQISMVASSMAFSWSKWNTEINSDERIILQGADHLQDEPLLEEDWSLFMVTKKRTTKLKMTEFDEAFSDDHADGTEFHADLYHMVMDIVGEDAKQRIRDTNYKFNDSIYQMLKNTRVVTYS